MTWIMANVLLLKMMRCVISCLISRKEVSEGLPVGDIVLDLNVVNADDDRLVKCLFISGNNDGEYKTYKHKHKHAILYVE